MKRILFILTLSIFSLNAFAISETQIQSEEISQQKETIELYIDANGKVFVDGKKISIKKLEKALVEIKEKKGLVKFANADKSQKMGGKRLEVMKLLRKHQIAVEVYSDNTYSKVIRL